MKCKIAEFVSSTADGGAETLVKDYMLLLDKNKFDPVLIVRRRLYNTANNMAIEKNESRIIVIYKSNSFLMKVIQKLNDWWYIPYYLKKTIKQENIEVLHIHLDFLKFVKKISGQIKNVKLFYTCHNDPKVLHLVNKKERKAAEYLIKNNGLQMIALHEDMKKEINEMFGINNTIVVRNGIDFKKFRNVTESREQIRTLLNIPQNAFVIGHVGRFCDQKNHTFLVDIFSEVYKRKSNAFLLMIGIGELKNKIENKLNSLGLKGKYLILSNRSDIPQLMKSMDVFVFPSLFEGLSLTLVEAQVSGLRCVISDTINKEGILSKNTIPVSLNKTFSEWSSIILDDSIKGAPHGSIDDYDMNKEIKRLEELYFGKSNN